VKELKNIERQNRIQREDKIFKILEQAMKKKKVKKIPPPTVPLPLHLLPRKLVDDLGLQQ